VCSEVQQQLFCRKEKLKNKKRHKKYESEESLCFALITDKNILYAFVVQSCRLRAATQKQIDEREKERERERGPEFKTMDPENDKREWREHKEDGQKKGRE